MGTVVLYHMEREGGLAEEAMAAWRPHSDPLASSWRDQGLDGSWLRVRGLRVTNQATLKCYLTYPLHTISLCEWYMTVQNKHRNLFLFYMGQFSSEIEEKWIMVRGWLNCSEDKESTSFYGYEAPVILGNRESKLSYWLCINSVNKIFPFYYNMYSVRWW